MCIIAADPALVRDPPVSRCTLTPNPMPTAPSPSAPIGLALAGGGFTGAIYEIGALRALEEAIDGLHFNDLSIYVGVSAGALLGSCLANKIDTRSLCRLIALGTDEEHTFSPSTFQHPDIPTLVRRGLRLPGLMGNSLWHYLTRFSEGDRATPAWAANISEVLPVGFFDNGPIGERLEALFAEPGRTDDFRELDQQLYIVATELATGKATVFGTPTLNHIPISHAVMASSALPGLYPPVEIENRYFVDGVLIKTMHASVALDQGAALVFAINPIVPFDATQMVEAGEIAPDAFIKKGMPTVLSQTFRTLIHSRLEIGMAAYDQKYPNADVLLFEPPREEAHMFFSNVFSFKNRKRICEYGFRATLTHLRTQADQLAPILARNGFTLRMDVVNNKDLDVWQSVQVQPIAANGTAASAELNNTLNTLDEMLESVEH